MSKGILTSFWLLVSLYFVFRPIFADENMKNVMEQNEIVPDLISVAPELTLQVFYEGGLTVDRGGELTPTQVKNQPIVLWDPEPDSFYTLMLVSPDAPSRKEPTMKDHRNWMVANIPGNDISQGDVLVEYVGSGAPAGTGLHRYVFLLYKQPEKIVFNEERISNTMGLPRFHFSTQKFVENYNLGAAKAGNFFQAQYDDYVPELHKQLSEIEVFKT